ncbi:SurA N-terminal domain-containing protein [Isachenkonia alkalipeptolytica]|uniref:Peptidylprolyl isomerase n=1 Tax=Isachenkonia alkalipeptolytica TaxID=2565777 RepID=A0AA43XJV1_9CLOT|nr:SurA N-terminal domain-containing protein [Isachenkonia alkalipeptolytica]NBG87967.1 hypothetical protein [Isachenkonia alkalipeptolytica]
MTKKRIMLFGIAVLSIFLLTACGNGDDNGDNGTAEENGSQEEAPGDMEGPEALDLEDFDADEALLVINGEEITREEFEAQFERTKQMVAQQYGIDLDADENAMLLPELQHQTIENIIGQRVLTQEAENQGMEVTDEEIDENIGMLVQQFGGEEGFQEALEADNLTEEDLEQMVYEELLISQLFETELNFDDIEVTDEEIEAFYAQYEMAQEQQGEEVLPLEEIEEQLIAQLQQQKAQEQQQAYVAELMDESDIERLY